MRNRIRRTMSHVVILGLLLCCMSGAKQTSDQGSKIKKLVEQGEFTKAEKLLRSQVADPTAPITSEPAIQLEVLRRTRNDFALTDKEVLEEVKQSIPNATQADVDRWRKAGDL